MVHWHKLETPMIIPVIIFSLPFYNYDFYLHIPFISSLDPVFGITHIPGIKIYDDNKTRGECCPNSSVKWFLAQIWYGLSSKPVRRNILYTSNTMFSSVTHEMPNSWGSGTRLYWWINVCQLKDFYIKCNIYFIWGISYPELF